MQGDAPPIMQRHKLSNLLIYVTAGLMALTGLLHLSGYSGVNAAAQATGSADVQQLLPLLWLVVGVDLVVTGLIVALVAFENSNGGRLVLFAAAISPIAAAGLQVVYLGFIPPTALLLLDGALAIASAVWREPRRRRSSM